MRHHHRRGPSRRALPAPLVAATTSPGPGTISLVDAARRWLAHYVATTRNAKGQRLACTRLIRYVLPTFGDVPLGTIGGDGIRGLRLALEQQWGLSPHTVTHVLSDVRCLLRWAVSEGLLARSPFPPRVMPRISEVAPRGFTEAQVAQLEALPGLPGFVLRLLLGTGLRWAEACRATRAHVCGGLLEVEHTKSGRLRRVPLSSELRAEIACWAYRLVPYAVGSPGSFSRMIRHHTGIADFHVHRCRHTFAMRWLAAGGNLAVLQQVLGHRDLATTMRYARVTDELIEREGERVSARLRRQDDG